MDKETAPENFEDAPQGEAVDEASGDGVTDAAGAHPQVEDTESGDGVAEQPPADSFNDDFDEPDEDDEAPTQIPDRTGKFQVFMYRKSNPREREAVTGPLESEADANKWKAELETEYRKNSMNKPGRAFEVVQH